MPEARAMESLAIMRDIENVSDVGAVTALLQTQG
jgi:hypothetical protein